MIRDVCLCRPPLFPLLTFVTSLTSAHSLLSTRQDPRRVNNADTLQDLVGHLGTLKPDINTQEKRHINGDKMEFREASFV